MFDSCKTCNYVMLQRKYQFGLLVDFNGLPYTLKHHVNAIASNESLILLGVKYSPHWNIFSISPAHIQHDYFVFIHVLLPHLLNQCMLELERVEYIISVPSQMRYI